jgi:hypothetical protein
MALTNSDKKFCLSNGVNIEKIKLHRHGKKRWSFDGADEKSVEYAVLDYFRAQGWEGYFTEYENYWFCLVIIMGYPNWRKRHPITIQTTSDLFYNTKDGFNSRNPREADPIFRWEGRPRPPFEMRVCQPQRDVHDLTFDEVWESIHNFNVDTLIPTLEYFKEKNLKRMGFGTVASGQKGIPSVHRIDAEKLKSFYESHGKETIIKLLEKFYCRKNVDIIQKCYRMSHLHHNIARHNGINIDELFTDENPSFSINLYYCCGVLNKEEAHRGLSMLKILAAKFLEIGRKDISDFILQCCTDILDYRNAVGMDLEPMPAGLDLFMWRGQELAAVEVKAPNDKLRVGQKETLLQKDNVKKWVVEVEDVTSNSADNLKAKKKPNTREASGGNRSQKHNPGKAQDLAKLADTLRAEGLWSDLMKEVVYLATQGKNVSLKERQLFQEELAERQDLSELLLRHLS